MDLQKLKNIRQHLHKNPELSGVENNTAQYLIQLASEFNPDQIIKFQDTGFALLFKGSESGNNILFRAELDALPILEDSNLEYRSQEDGVAHLCGHDGHMAILLGLASKISQQRPKFGNVIILFQPAEETGQGAQKISTDLAFKALNPNMVFALHNIPGQPLGQIICRPSVISAASQGLEFKINGRSSHAAHPEEGLSPVSALQKLIKKYQELNQEASTYPVLTFLTIVYMRLGGKAYGTSPGEAEMGLTLRSFSNEQMNDFRENCLDIMKQVCEDEGLDYSFQDKEVFPATENNPDAFQLIKKAAGKNKLSFKVKQEPFRWSEDFSFFTLEHAGALFGIGAGENQPPLHHPTYDFPDELLIDGINMFYEIYNQYQQINYHD